MLTSVTPQYVAIHSLKMSTKNYDNVNVIKGGFLVVLFKND